MLLRQRYINNMVRIPHPQFLYTTLILSKVGPVRGELDNDVAQIVWRDWTVHTSPIRSRGAILAIRRIMFFSICILHIEPTLCDVSRTSTHERFKHIRAYYKNKVMWGHLV